MNRQNYSEQLIVLSSLNFRYRQFALKSRREHLYLSSLKSNAEGRISVQSNCRSRSPLSASTSGQGIIGLIHNRHKFSKTNFCISRSLTGRGNSGNSQGQGQGKGFCYKSSGVNPQGNHYCSRDYGSNAPNPNSYHYSNANGSYYYSNNDGSKYYNDGSGTGRYNPPGSGDQGQGNQ